MNITKLEQKFILNVRNCENIQYGGSEFWKRNRTFKGFPYTAKDLQISQKHFQQLKTLQRQVWLFCDTIIMNNIQGTEHILDYSMHGQRMGWKVGDEYWLVFNIMYNRLEIRKADPSKWDPLQKYIIDDKLQIHLTLAYLQLPRKNSPLYVFFNKQKWKIKYIDVISINSFPDRIEINLNCLAKNQPESIENIFDYYRLYSSFQKDIIQNNISNLYEQLYNDDLQKQIAQIKKEFSGRKIYKLFNQNEKQDPEYYWNIFLKYNHQLKFWQDMYKRYKRNFINENIE